MVFLNLIIFFASAFKNITDSNFDKLIHHYPWGRINCVIDELINERSRSPSPFGLLFLPLKKINIVETESIEHKEEIDRQLYPTNMSCYSEYSVSTVTLNYRELEALVSSMCYSETSLQYFLNNYPVNSIWRFFIDADRKAISPRTFDIKEPGYIISCMQAFFNLLSEFDAKVTPEVIKQIHKDATHGVIIFSSHGKFRSRGFSKFGFVAEVSPSGLFELEMTQNELNYTLHKHEEYSYINDNHYKIICGQVDLNFIDRKVQEITDTYEERLKDIPGEVSKVSSEQAIKLNIFLRLENIVIMIQKLERFHPFSDGNCRVFCMLLLYKELIRSELPLCLLTNPNDFDGLSKEEMILEILNGQNRYIELCSGAESLHYAGTYICRSFDISCELEITENQESISLALEAVNKSRESEVRSFFIDKINSYLDNLRYDMTTVASITS